MEKEVDEEGGGWRRRWMSKEVKSCSQFRLVVHVPVIKLNEVKSWCITERYHKLSMTGSKVGGGGWVQIPMENSNFLNLHSRITKNMPPTLKQIS